MPIALLITGADAQGRALGRLITDHDADGLVDAAALAVGQDVVAIQPELVRFRPDDRHVVKAPVHDAALVMPPLAAGDVVLADKALGWPDGRNTAVYLVDAARVLGRASSDAEAVALVNATRPPLERSRDFFVVADDLVGLGELIYEADAERASREPDEALILAWRTEDGTIDSHILDHTGAYLFWNLDNGRSCAEASVTEPDGPGLWLLTKGETWSSTDWESGIVDSWGLEGELEAITLEAAAKRFKTTISGLRATIRDVYPFQHNTSVMRALHLKAGDPATAPAMTR